MNHILLVLVFVVLTGCIASEPASEQQQPLYSAPAPTVAVIPEITGSQTTPDMRLWLSNPQFQVYFMVFP